MNYVNNQYLVGCNNMQSVLCSSTDGVTWSLSNIKAVDLDYNRLYYVNGQYLIFDKNNNYPQQDRAVLTMSSDLLTWYASMTNTPIINNLVTLNNAQFAISSRPDLGGERSFNDGYNNFFSPINYRNVNDSRFTPATYTLSSYEASGGNKALPSVNGIASNGNVYVAASLFSLAYSMNGKDWLDYYPDAYSDYITFNNVKYVKNQFMAVTDNGMIYTSKDGLPTTKWTTQGISGKPILTDILYNNGRYILVGVDGYLAYSDTGLVNSWKPIATGTTNAIFAVVGNNANILIAVGESGLMLYSTNNGSSFEPVSSEHIINSVTSKTQQVTTDINSILYDAIDGFIAVGDNGVILNSKDGINWSYSVNNSTQNYQSISLTK